MTDQPKTTLTLADLRARRDEILAWDHTQLVDQLSRGAT